MAGKKRVIEMQREQMVLTAEQRKQENILKTESEANVRKADAKNQLENAKVIFEKDKLVMIADAMREAHSTKAAADFYREDELTKAAGEMATLKSSAEKIQLDAQVESHAIKTLDAQRKHELAVRETSIWGEYAKSADLRLLGAH